MWAPKMDTVDRCHNVKEFALAANVARKSTKFPPFVSDYNAGVCRIVKKFPLSLCRVSGFFAQLARCGKSGR